MTRTLHFVAEAPPVEARRDVVTAVRRGFFGRCPQCGEGRMFRVLSQGGRRLSRLRRGSEPAARGRRARLRHDADHGAFHRRRHPRGGRTMAEFADLAARHRLVRARCSVFAVAVATSQGRAGRLSMGDADARLRRPGERVQLKPGVPALGPGRRAALARPAARRRSRRARARKLIRLDWRCG